MRETNFLYSDKQTNKNNNLLVKTNIDLTRKQRGTDCKTTSCPRRGFPRNELLLSTASHYYSFKTRSEFCQWCFSTFSFYSDNKFSGSIQIFENGSEKLLKKFRVAQIFVVNNYCFLSCDFQLKNRYNYKIILYIFAKELFHILLWKGVKHEKVFQATFLQQISHLTGEVSWRTCTFEIGHIFSNNARVFSRRT